jgi:2-oxoglutarate dehydrogenase E1 component
LAGLHTLAVTAGWLEELLEQHAAAPESAPEDWRRALAILDACFPEARSEQRTALLDRFGHLLADLDPLDRVPHPRWARLSAAIERRLELAARQERSPLAVETGHLDDLERVDWICARRRALGVPAPETRRRALDALLRAEIFESFVGRRYPGKKRFGAEGAEGMHVVVGRILDRAREAGVEEVVVAPMHRGRLGLMSCVFGQPPGELFALMNGAHPLRDEIRAGDVPYHMGWAGTYAAPAGSLRVRVLPNPSHLEAVNAVALGYARRRQEAAGGPGKVMPLILHTDASVIAQGVVAEGLQLVGTPGHEVGGAVHVIVNNQIGFTTEPHEARSSRWCTGAFKAVDSLISHVNGDRIDAVATAASLAVDYRMRFGGESVVDLVCVRANGHNELDEPRFTQPDYYARADGRGRISEAYARDLETAGVCDPTLSEGVASGWRAELELAFQSARPAFQEIAPARVAAKRSATLDRIVELAAQLPQATVHPKAARLVAQRAEEWRADAVSWATAEVLAFGAALSSGRDVRFAGQDAERGPFSQRHLALLTTNGEKRPVFEAAPSDWGRLTVLNTPLTEYAALGFAYGYAVAAPETLTIWEAQFGDFANVAQVIFDQFICSGEEKWGQQSNLVVLLPHGLEGQGPEHSSARLERLLQLCAKDNLLLAQPSTPANVFHLLQRQAARPTIVASPKRLLRLKAATSPRADFDPSVGWRPALRAGAARAARRVVVCSGKIAYEVEARLVERRETRVAVVRLEQLYPFPDKEVAAALELHCGADLVWLQEEPVNFGAGAWLKPQLEAVAAAPVSIIARPQSPSPAGSFHGRHEADQAALVEAATTLVETGLRGAA